MEKIRIAFCMQQIITGGVEKCLERMLDEMSKSSEYKFKIIVKNPHIDQAFVDFFAQKNIPVIHFSDIQSCIGDKPKSFFKKKIYKIKKLFYTVIKQRQIASILKDTDIIVDYFNCSFCHELKNIRKPKIGWWHSSYKVYQTNNFQHHRVYDKFVCITDAFKQKLQSQDNETTNVVRIYNPFDVENIKLLAEKGSKPALQEKYFVFVGRMHTDKDHLTVIKAFSAISSKYPEIKLYFIGDGEKRKEYENIVRDYGLQDKIIFTGVLENPYGYMQNALACILSSPSEGLSNVLIESAILKTLAIASDCPDGPAEILLDGKSGLLFPVGDNHKLAELMENVVLQKIDSSAMVEEGYRHINRFFIQDIVAQFNNLIKSVLEQIK